MENKQQSSLRKQFRDAAKTFTAYVSSAFLGISTAVGLSQPALVHENKQFAIVSENNGVSGSLYPLQNHGARKKNTPQPVLPASEPVLVSGETQVNRVRRLYGAQNKKIKNLTTAPKLSFEDMKMVEKVYKKAYLDSRNRGPLVWELTEDQTKELTFAYINMAQAVGETVDSATLPQTIHELMGELAMTRMKLDTTFPRAGRFYEYGIAKKYIHGFGNKDANGVDSDDVMEYHPKTWFDAQNRVLPITTRRARKDVPYIAEFAKVSAYHGALDDSIMQEMQKALPLFANKERVMRHVLASENPMATLRSLHSTMQKMLSDKAFEGGSKTLMTRLVLADKAGEFKKLRATKKYQSVSSDVMAKAVLAKGDTRKALTDIVALQKKHKDLNHNIVVKAVMCNPANADAVLTKTVALGRFAYGDALGDLALKQQNIILAAAEKHCANLPDPAMVKAYGNMRISEGQPAVASRPATGDGRRYYAPILSWGNERDRHNVAMLLMGVDLVPESTLPTVSQYPLPNTVASLEELDRVVAQVGIEKEAEIRVLYAEMAEMNAREALVQLAITHVQEISHLGKRKGDFLAKANLAVKDFGYKVVSDANPAVGKPKNITVDTMMLPFLVRLEKDNGFHPRQPDSTTRQPRAGMLQPAAE